MKVKVSRKKSALKEFQFLESQNLALLELKTEQIRQPLRAFWAIHSYSIKDGWIRAVFFHEFCKWDFPVSLRSVARFLQMLFDNNQARMQVLYEVNLPTAF